MEQDHAVQRCERAAGARTPWQKAALRREGKERRACAVSKRGEGRHHADFALYVNVHVNVYVNAYVFLHYALCFVLYASIFVV